MHSTTTVAGVLGADECLLEHPVRGQLTALDGLVDARQVLHHDGARTEVEMADLRVAHLALGEADRSTARHEERVGVAVPQLVEHRSARQRNRIARPTRGDPPAVEHDQRRSIDRQRARRGRAGGHREPTVIAPPR
jgi:hypothetical protein